MKNKNEFQSDAYRPLIDRISSYPTHDPPPQPFTPTTTHVPQPPQPCTPPQPCMPPYNHTCPPATMQAPQQPRTPPATMHAPRNHTHPPHNHTRPPVNRMTNKCKNITLRQTSFAGGISSNFTCSYSERHEAMTPLHICTLRNTQTQFVFIMFIHKIFQLLLFWFKSVSMVTLTLFLTLFLFLNLSYCADFKAFPIKKWIFVFFCFFLYWNVLMLFVLAQRPSDVCGRLSVIVVVDYDGFTVVLRRIQLSVSSSSCARSYLRRVPANKMTSMVLVDRKTDRFQDEISPNTKK